LTEEERRHVRAVVDLLRPGHSHFVSLIEPTAPPADETWVLGDGELGAATALALA